MKRALGAVALALVSVGHAAVPNLEDALKLPIENRVQALRAHGDGTVEELSALVFNKSQPLTVRWRSLTALARLNRAKAQPLVEKALASDDWFMRNAAVVSLPSMEREFALTWSEKMISDPALVVRTSAVQNILRLSGRRSEALLWQKLNAKENFRNGESLWIRRHIARTLAEFAKPGKEAQYIQMLNDHDARLHPFAIRALERITGRQPDSPNDPLAVRRTKWLQWWASLGASPSLGS